MRIKRCEDCAHWRWDRRSGGICDIANYEISGVFVACGHFLLPSDLGRLESAIREAGLEEVE